MVMMTDAVQTPSTGSAPKRAWARASLPGAVIPGLTVIAVVVATQITDGLERALTYAIDLGIIALGVIAYFALRRAALAAPRRCTAAWPPRARSGRA